MDGAVYGIIYSGISAGQGSPSSIFEAVSSQHCIRAVSEHPAVCKAQLGGAGLYSCVTVLPRTMPRLPEVTFRRFPHVGCVKAGISYRPPFGAHAFPEGSCPFLPRHARSPVDLRSLSLASG
jgi:hypothetical protein